MTVSKVVCHVNWYCFHLVWGTDHSQHRHHSGVFTPIGRGIAKLELTISEHKRPEPMSYTEMGLKEPHCDM